MLSQENLNRSFAMADSAFEKMWDMWLVGLGSMSWSQEQLENMAKKYLEQRKTAREESTKVIEELMQQVKKNQQQMNSMVQEAVKAAMENIDIPSFNTLDELKKKVDDLSQKVDELMNDKK